MKIFCYDVKQNWVHGLKVMSSNLTIKFAYIKSGNFGRYSHNFVIIVNKVVPPSSGVSNSLGSSVHMVSEGEYLYSKAYISTDRIKVILF
jgi:hypothetical protein